MWWRQQWFVVFHRCVASQSSPGSPLLLLLRSYWWSPPGMLRCWVPSHLSVTSGSFTALRLRWLSLALAGYILQLAPQSSSDAPAPGRRNLQRLVLLGLDLRWLSLPFPVFCYSCRSRTYPNSREAYWALILHARIQMHLLYKEVLMAFSSERRIEGLPCLGCH